MPVFAGMNRVKEPPCSCKQITGQDTKTILFQIRVQIDFSVLITKQFILMSVSHKTQRILSIKSGNMCAFLGCKKPLISYDDRVILGEIAHIVAKSPDGPRGDSPLSSSERDTLDNLIFLCEEHHKTIDAQPDTFTVPKLLQMKKDHERWVKENLSFKEQFEGVRQPEEHVTDLVYSTILPVEMMPRYVYEAESNFRFENEAKDLVVYPQRREEITPFILHGGKLIAFHDLSDQTNPFVKIADPFTTKKHNAATWWDDPDTYRLFVALLNRSLNKLCGRKGLMLDKAHQRYYFQLDEGVSHKVVRYRPLNQSNAERKVVWRPITRITGMEKKYYEHYAVNLKFHLVSKSKWCLSIRPERRFTTDGQTSLESKRIGPRSTRLKSRMYNIDLLGEINFWRDYFADRSPRITLKFGSQHILISTELMNAEISWPGVPGDSKAFRNITYEENLFSLADLLQATDEYKEDEVEHGIDYEC